MFTPDTAGWLTERVFYSERLIRELDLNASGWEEQRGRTLEALARELGFDPAHLAQEGYETLDALAWALRDWLDGHLQEAVAHEAVVDAADRGLTIGQIVGGLIQFGYGDTQLDAMRVRDVEKAIRDKWSFIFEQRVLDVMTRWRARRRDRRR